MSRCDVGESVLTSAQAVVENLITFSDPWSMAGFLWNVHLGKLKKKEPTRFNLHSGLFNNFVQSQKMSKINICTVNAD